MKKPVIICVDDEPIILDSLEIELSKVLSNNCRIETADGGEDALELLSELLEEGEKIAVVICDYIMPYMKGDELLKRIHAISPKTLKILLTGQADIEAVENAIRYANLYRYIAKPWQPEDLKLTVLEALHSYLQEKELAEKNAQLQQIIQELEQLNTSLEQKVADRTIELTIANAQLQKAKEAAEVANRAKTKFLARMSHELRTPLNAILGFTQVISRNLRDNRRAFNQEVHEHLGIISRSGEHLLELINGILEMSKIEAGLAILDQNPFDLYSLLDRLFEVMQFKAKSKGLELVFERTSEVPQYIQTDESKLRQVLINLLDNAIKFTPEGRVTLRVKKGQTTWAITHTKQNLTNAECLRVPAFLVFEVEDTGIGIPPEEIDTLFKPFVQGERGDRVQEGTGLGLPICQYFVQLMGGEIAVSTRLGQGTIFTFDAPIGIAEATNKGKLPVASLMPSRKVVSLAPDQRVYRILVADDQCISRQLLVKMLTSVSFEVREAQNGIDAIALWNSWEPHLIWMDMQMPIMDGYETTKHIKSHLKGQATVIIALTASSFDPEQTVILGSGCDDFVRTPFREEVIFEKMAQYLGVRYIYEDPQENIQLQVPSANSQIEQPLEVHLSQLPAEWVAKLREAAAECSSDIIFELIDQIPESHIALANTLKDWANNFLFHEIMAITEQAGN